MPCTCSWGASQGWPGWAQPWVGVRVRAPETGPWEAGRPAPTGPSAGPSSVFRALQQYSSFQTDKLECGQLGSWRASPPASAAAPPEQPLHSEGGDLLYAPSYSLPFSYHYGHFPLDSHVFSSKKPVLPAKFGPPQGSPCEVARFFLSTLPASSECQWHYASPLMPSSPSPAKTLPEPPVSAARHSLVPNYEGGSCLLEGKGQGSPTAAVAAVGGMWTKDPHTVGQMLPFSAAGQEWPHFPALHTRASREWIKLGE